MAAGHTHEWSMPWNGLKKSYTPPCRVRLFISAERHLELKIRAQCLLCCVDALVLDWLHSGFCGRRQGQICYLQSIRNM